MAMQEYRIDIHSFQDFLKLRLEAQSIIEPLENMIINGTSPAGKQREGVFAREFLCPEIVRYFEIRQSQLKAQLNLSSEDIKRGLGTEGVNNRDGFGFTPASSKRNLFTKSNVINQDPPKSWFKSSTATPSAFQACPDFAIGKPLPFTAVGEVKYIKRPLTDATAVRELYNAARQATFYLATFRQHYESAIIVIADASRDHTFLNGMKSVHPDLLDRFGEETGIHLVTAGLH